MRIVGAGWVGQTAYGTVCKELHNAYSGDLRQMLHAGGILTERVKNAGKFDSSTRQLFCAAALALHDAMFSNDWKNVALIGTGKEECTLANQTYFEDYAGHGRQLARANLFIYTLPTSPLAEIAIHFNLGGPLFYTSEDILPAANRLLASGESYHVLALLPAEDLAVAVLFDSKNDDEAETARALEDLLASIRVHSR